MTTETAAGSDYEVLLRAGFPYEKTLGMRRITWYPIDIEVGPENEVHCLGRFDVGGSIRTVSWADKDLGGIGGGWTWPSGMAQDQDGRLFISDEGAHNITILRTDGEEVARWGEYGTDVGQLNKPSHMVFDRNGDLLISDTQNHRIQKFSADGKFISTFGSFGSEVGQFNMPWGVAVAPGGEIVVSVWGNDRFQVFSETGKPIDTFGSSGSERGELSRPAGIAVDEDGDIYIADRGNDRVCLFDRNGRYVEQFIGDSTLGEMGRIYILTNLKVLRLRDMAHLEPIKRFKSPSSVRAKDGRLFVGDYGCHRVQVYKKEAYRLSADEVMDKPVVPNLFTV